jgi:hypothetical protein
MGKNLPNALQVVILYVYMFSSLFTRHIFSSLIPGAQLCIYVRAILTYIISYV